MINRLFCHSSRPPCFNLHDAARFARLSPDAAIAMYGEVLLARLVDFAVGRYFSLPRPTHRQSWLELVEDISTLNMALPTGVGLRCPSYQAFCRRVRAFEARTTDATLTTVPHHRRNFFAGEVAYGRPCSFYRWITSVDNGGPATTRLPRI